MKSVLLFSVGAALGAAVVIYCWNRYESQLSSLMDEAFERPVENPAQAVDDKTADRLLELLEDDA